MKTIDDLNALIPQLIDLVLDDPQIGNSYYDQDEDGFYGRNDEYEENYVCYEEDGWFIEISFECCGEWSYDPGDYWTPESLDLVKAWGKVTEINAGHYDEETDEDTEFSEEDTKELWSAIDKALETL